MQRLCHRLGYPTSDRRDAGFTLVEVVVSFVLFAIVAGGAVTGIVNSIQASHRSQERVAAANVAQSIMAASRTNTSAAKNGTDTFSSTVDGEQYSVQRTVTFDADGATQCSAGATFVVNVVVSSSSGSQLARSDARVLC